jgi:hypothetical protein
VDVDIGTSRVARLLGVALMFGDTIPGTSVSVFNYVNGSSTQIGPNATHKHMEMTVRG